MQYKRGRLSDRRANRVSTLQESLERLYALIPRGRKYGLERMEAACAKLGNPERAYEAVHVAGTNGKGSVCAFLEAMLRASGKSVGMYTSPHLHRLAERFRIGGQPIGDDQLVDLIDRVMTQAPDLSFFETTTMIGLLAFKEAGVETAVIEVGLGGRLDATNVIPPPRAAAITRIAFDHMPELGDSISKIAAEKAAIIKAGTVVVTGRLHPDASDVVDARITAVGARRVALGDPEPYEGAQLAYPRMAMCGTNLAVATTLARELGCTPQQIAEGIESTSWPGRNELLHRNGQELTLLDCAHNPDATVTLSHIIEASLAEGLGSRKQVALVFGAVEGKNWRAMLARLDQSTGHRIFVKPQTRRAVSPEAMAAVSKGEVAPSIERALVRARELVGPGGLIVVTGSIFLVGPARAMLLGAATDPVTEV